MSSALPPTGRPASLPPSDHVAPAFAYPPGPRVPGDHRPLRGPASVQGPVPPGTGVRPLLRVPAPLQRLPRVCAIVCMFVVVHAEYRCAHCAFPPGPMSLIHPDTLCLDPPRARLAPFDQLALLHQQERPGDAISANPEFHQSTGPIVNPAHSGFGPRWNPWTPRKPPSCQVSRPHPSLREVRSPLPAPLPRRSLASDRPCARHHGRRRTAGHDRNATVAAWILFPSPLSAACHSGRCPRSPLLGMGRDP